MRHANPDICQHRLEIEPCEDLASLRVFMGTLRKKIEPDPVRPRNIQTHIGVGYRMMRVTDE